MAARRGADRGTRPWRRTAGLTGGDGGAPRCRSRQEPPQPPPGAGVVGDSGAPRPCQAQPEPVVPRHEPAVVGSPVPRHNRLGLNPGPPSRPRTGRAVGAEAASPAALGRRRRRLRPRLTDGPMTTPLRDCAESKIVISDRSDRFSQRDGPRTSPYRGVDRQAGAARRTSHLGVGEAMTVSPPPHTHTSHPPHPQPLCHTAHTRWFPQTSARTWRPAPAGLP